MAKAIWNGQVVAESDQYEVVKGNIYLPPTSIRSQYFRPSNHTSRYIWKGEAHYYDLLVDGKENKDAACYYPDPSRAAKKIKDHVAFWHGVHVEQ